MRVARDLESVTASSVPSLSSRTPRCRVQSNAIFLEIFSGCGALSKSIRQQKLESVEIEILKCANYDVSQRPVQELILKWIRQGKVWGLHLGTPCTIWSIARTRVANSAKNRKKERLGRMFAAFTVQVCELCAKVGIPWSIENPKTSKIWNGPLLRLHSIPGAAEVFYDSCMYGSQFKKPTKLLTTFSSLSLLARQCDGRHEHVLAQGSVKVLLPGGKSKWINRTTLAGAYEPLLCRKWAKLISRSAPPSAAKVGSTRLDEFVTAIAAVARPHAA